MCGAWNEYFNDMINEEQKKVLIHLKDGTIIDTGSEYEIDWYAKHIHDFTLLSYTVKLTGERESFYIPDGCISFVKTYR